MRLELVVQFDEDDRKLLRDVRALLYTTLERMKKMDQALSQAQQDAQNLTAAVAAESTVIDSAIVAITGIPAIVADAVSKALAAAGVDATVLTQAVQAATTEATAKRDQLLTALTQNTPSQPTGDGQQIPQPPADIGEGNNQVQP